ncbi:MAG: hypothetical protein ABII72_03755 [Parcubacteria group bacterium]
MKIIYITLSLILAVTGLTGCSLGQNKMSDQVTVNYTSDDGLEVKVKEVKTDKLTYHSREDLTVSVALESLQQSGEVLLEISGLKDGYGDDFISQKKLLEVSTAEETKYIQTFSLPECSTCAGFPEGEYIITVAASQAGQKLAEKTTTFMFQP